MHAMSDLGIVLVASGDGSGVFTTRTGQPGTARTLTEAHYIGSDWFDGAGRFNELFITVSGVVSVAMFGFTVILERRRVDEGGLASHPSVIGTLRCDDPMATKATQQTITRGQLIGQNVSDWPDGTAAVEDLDVVLSTTDHRGATECRVLVIATAAPEPTDRIIVAIRGA